MTLGVFESQQKTRSAAAIKPSQRSFSLSHLWDACPERLAHRPHASVVHDRCHVREERGEGHVRGVHRVRGEREQGAQIIRVACGRGMAAPR